MSFAKMSAFGERNPDAILPIVLARCYSDSFRYFKAAVSDVRGSVTISRYDLSNNVENI